MDERTELNIEMGASPTAEALPYESAPEDPTLRKRHSLAIRWMHWINFPLLFTMIWSGLAIYWADSDIADVHPHQTYRIGLGHWTLVRLFPDWFYARLHLTYSLGEGLGWHLFFMWLFALNGIVYVAYLAISGTWRDLLPRQGSLRQAWQVLLHDLYLRKDCPNVKGYTGAQRIAYTLILLAGAGSLLTGAAIYKPVQLHPLTTLLGGYEGARWLHFWLTVSFVVFFIIHVLQVARAGWNNFRSIVAGYELVREEPPPNIRGENL